MNWQLLSGTDRGISYGIAGHITRLCPWLRPLDSVLGALAHPAVLIMAVVAASWWLYQHGGRSRRAAVLLLLVPLPLAIGVTEGVKELVRRPRFQDVLVQPKQEGFSFPSGSALAAAAVYGSIGILLGRRLRGWAAWLVETAAFVLPFVIGVSRLFVLHHYLTDVFAGWGAGAAIALLCRGVDVMLNPEERKQRVVPAVDERLLTR
jgi:undecaprenyl-diphosphatase